MTQSSHRPGRLASNPLQSLPKPAIKWSDRDRATRADVQRYSRFVVIMKRALPMAAAALVAAVVAYALQPRVQDSRRVAMSFERLGIVNNDLSMTKPKLTGVDSDGDPFVVTADQAIQDSRNAKRAQLRGVEADVTLKNGKWLNVTASRGELDADAQRLGLRGVIDLYSDTGYELHTSAADVDMRNGIIVGDRPATGQGPSGTFRADRFAIKSVGGNMSGIRADRTPHDAFKARAQKIIYLQGNVQMTLYQRRSVRK